MFSLSADVVVAEVVTAVMAELVAICPPLCCSASTIAFWSRLA